MGKDIGSWVHQQCPPHEAPNLNSTTFVPNSAWQNVLPDSAKQGHLVSNETGLEHARNGVSQVKTCLSNGPSDWFYGLPRYRQTLTPTPNCVPKEFNVYPEGYKGNAATNAVPRPVEKKFVVFDRSGNQTRWIYSPGTAYPTQSNNVAASGAVDCCGLEELRTKAGPSCDGHICSDAIIGSQESQAAEESEMHEDTEELNALLYSDEEEDEFGCECGCEEEVSTGHSPSKKTTRLMQEDNASAEEVASSGGSHHLKRKRSPDGEWNMSALMDTASSGKPNRSWECEDDAESSCGESSSDGGDSSSCSSPVKKRLNKDKIRETVKILQSILPCGEGKDAMYVLDEAIQYLKSLKLKAQSLGDSLD